MIHTKCKLKSVVPRVWIFDPDPSRIILSYIVSYTMLWICGSYLDASNILDWSMNGELRLSNRYWWMMRCGSREWSSGTWSSHMAMAVDSWKHDPRTMLGTFPMAFPSYVWLPDIPLVSHETSICFMNIPLISSISHGVSWDDIINIYHQYIPSISISHGVTTTSHWRVQRMMDSDQLVHPGAFQQGPVGVPFVSLNQLIPIPDHWLNMVN